MLRLIQKPIARSAVITNAALSMESVLDGKRCITDTKCAGIQAATLSLYLEVDVGIHTASTTGTHVNRILTVLTQSRHAARLLTTSALH